MATIVNQTIHGNSCSCPKWHLALDLRWQLQLSNHGNCSSATWQLQLNEHGRGSGPWQLRGRVVTVTRGVRDREVGG